MPELTDPVQLAGRRAPSRVLFGPHPTNLGRRRAFSDRHVAYYARRAAGGAGIVVTETASVHPSDWPYERAPLAADCAPGWAAVAEACARHGTLVLAGLGHTGGQGSSAYSQAALWAPSRVPDAATRELPAEMEQPEIDAVVAGFAEAAGLAARAGLDGVEVDAGPVSLLRQFLSGLTNQRGDGYGDDKPRLLREVLAAVRDALGPDRVLALRLACDELVPWAGITPEQVDRIGHVGALADSIDLLVVVKGRPYSTAAYRPTAHIPPGFNLELCRAMRDAAAGRVPVALQGSVADPALARSALDDGVADLVELTRAQIADAELVAKVRAGTPERVRPCILCNQACLVADARNPIVSCVTDPRSGHETTDPDPARTDPVPGRVLVVGGGPAGLECARVLAGRGHRVRLAERTGRLGGALRAAAVGPGRGRLALLTDWLEAECRRLGVEIETGREIGPGDLAGAGTGGEAVVLATGSVAAPRRYAPAGAGVPTGDAEGLPGPDAPPTADLTTVVDVLDLLERGPDGLPDGPVVIHDPVGAQTGVAAAEWLAGLGREVALVTPDQVAGTQLSRTGDLAGANVRLQRAGIRRELRALLRAVGGGRAVLEDVWTGARREIGCAVLVDCAHRLPEESLYLAAGPGTARAGTVSPPAACTRRCWRGRRRALKVGARAPQPAGAGP
jgi:2,4-dienoyl-CoA reductase (NADPH2)